MPDITIRDRWNDRVIYSGDHETIAKAVAACIAKDISLSRADLAGADLSNADLVGVDLSDANLSSADLFDADLSRANLARATLSDARLSYANLSRARLVGATLTNADLSIADLTRADLTRADLFGADLTRADLSRATLTSTNLTGATIDSLTAARLSVPPEIGEFTGFKKVASGRVIMVRIPADARRSNSTTRKCRAEYVIPIDMGDATEEVSRYDASFVYRLNEPARCDKWEQNRWIECGGGIHFFLTRAEAEAY